jgi:hypothetical protein
MKKKKFLIHPSTHPPSIHSSIHPPSIHPSINHGTLVGASERLGDGMKRGKCPTTVTGKGQNKFGWVREEQLSWFCHLCGVLSLPKKRKSLVLTYLLTYLLTVFFYLPEETCTLKTLHKVQLGFFHELLLGLFLAYQGKGH